MNNFSYPQIIIPVATILFGGLLSAMVTQTMTTFRADTERRLAKLEELYKAVQDAFIWGKRFQDLRIALFTRAVEVQDAREIKILRDKIDNEHVEDYKKLMVICDIWFPDLKKSSQELINSISKMGHFVENAYKAQVMQRANPKATYNSSPNPEGDIFHWRDVLAAKSLRRLMRLGE